MNKKVTSISLIVSLCFCIVAINVLTHSHELWRSLCSLFGLLVFGSFACINLMKLHK